MKTETAEQVGLWIQGLAALGTVLAAIATIWLLRTTIKQFRLMLREAREQHQPYVYADLRNNPPYQPILALVYENTGPTVASQVRIQFDPPLLRKTLHSGVLAESSLLPFEIPSLPPGHRQTIPLGHMKELMDDPDFSKRYLITVTGKGPEGPMDELSYHIDLGVQSEISLEPKPHHGVIQELKKARELLGLLVRNVP